MTILVMQSAAIVQLLTIVMKNLTQPWKLQWLNTGEDQSQMITMGKPVVQPKEYHHYLENQNNLQSV